jgi:predicted phosphate transport protein (TIGR00153 family)
MISSTTLKIREQEITYLENSWIDQKEYGMSIFSRKKTNRFVELLIKQAEYTVEGMQKLLEYVREPSAKLAQEVTAIEKEADEVRRVLIDELNRTFVTPIDREDIFALSLTIDDVLDYADTTVEELHMLRVTPNAFMERMVSLLTDAAREIYMGVMRLEDHPNVANDHAVRAKALENRMESVYREAIADLFAMPRDIDHVVDMLKLREIYRHLSNAADRGDQAANVLGDIVVKKM